MFDKIKTFVKEHKVAIIFGGAATVGIIGLGCVMKSLADGSYSETIYHAFGITEELEVPDSLKNYAVEKCFDYERAIEFMTRDNSGLKVSDLGNFGKAICDLPDVDENSQVWAIVNVAKN